jgi:hypothetical protein
MFFYNCVYIRYRNEGKGCMEENIFFELRRHEGFLFHYVLFEGFAFVSVMLHRDYISVLW